MKARAIVHFEQDLRCYLQHRSVLIAPEVDEVLMELNSFTSVILQSGFRKAVIQLLNTSDIRMDRPFIEVCDAIIEDHLRPLKKEDRDIVSKSLFEAFLHVAGTQYAFDPPGKTRFLRSLRRFGVKGFAELFISLHLFNVVSMEIHERVGATMPDLTSFELYMLNIEAVCRDVVTRAARMHHAEPDARWAAEIRRNIEGQLLSR